MAALPGSVVTVAEPEDAGCEPVPGQLVELYEVLEWEAAQAAATDANPPASIAPPLDVAAGLVFGTPFHGRADWGARARVCSSTNIRPEGVTVHYGGPSPWTGAVDRSSADAFAATTDHNRCPTIWRAYQAYHMDAKGWCDIAYSSGTCPHGHRYEGRGPGQRTGAQGTNDGNLRSYATCYIAGDGDPLTAAAMQAFVDEGDRLGKPLRWSHLQWHSTACPGTPLDSWRRAGFPSPDGPPPPPPPPPPPGGSTVNVPLPVLRIGMTGGGVRSLQALLNAKAGQGLTVDGAFGPRTQQAVTNVQAFFGLSRDGIVGQNTWGVLFL